jgi:uncharacterized membrane protein
MINKRSSLMSTGWLIIGIVMIVAGIYLVFIANSLHTETNLLNEYSSNEEDYSTINEIANRISVSVLFLIIASLIIIAIGVIMCVEWILFSKFIKKYSE